SPLADRRRTAQGAALSASFSRKAPRPATLDCAARSSRVLHRDALHESSAFFALRRAISGRFLRFDMKNPDIETGTELAPCLPSATQRYFFRVVLLWEWSWT
ncbi:MAG TPA: hypothetical protein VEZ59_13045, partial [Sphingopyxis sp.]|nr:hypothetical protein [Sphingopyxis sp.]